MPSVVEEDYPMRADIVAGAVFPDYELTDYAGKRRTLSELQGPDPMILVLSRGGYCPKDLRQGQGLVPLYREMEVGYCRLVTISTDNMLTTNEYRAGVGAHWTFLSDPGRKVQKDLDIAEYTDAGLPTGCFGRFRPPYPPPTRSRPNPPSSVAVFSAWQVAQSTCRLSG